jgi:hypothetical protein
VRIVLSAAMLLLATACGPLFPGPVELTLTNYRFPHAAIQAVVTDVPDCSALPPGTPPIAFDLPYKATRAIEAAPGGDVCWRRQVPGGRWSDWSRAFTATGRSVDLQL